MREQGAFSSDVRQETFRERDDLYMLYLAVNEARAAIEQAWLVPSSVLAAEGIVITKQGKEHLRFSASAKPDIEDKWRPYRMSGEELPQTLLAVVSSLEPAISDEDAEPVDEDA